MIVDRLNKVIEGEEGGISEIQQWKGGGEFAYFSFDKSPRIDNSLCNAPRTIQKNPVYHQLNLFPLFEEYGEKPFLENEIVREPNSIYYGHHKIEYARNVLISLVKRDNEDIFINRSATLYYTGKKFPSTVAFNKLYYFMPYLKGKGIRDLYIIKVARIGSRKEGQPDENNNDLRLVFEIEFVKQLFTDYKSIDLKIWRTFTDTILSEIIQDPMLND